MPASESYLTELAEEFLGLMVEAVRRDPSGKAPKGESTWIDPTANEPGVDVSTDFRDLPDGGIAIDVVAYDGMDVSNKVTRTAVVMR